MNVVKATRQRLEVGEACAYWPLVGGQSGIREGSSSSFVLERGGFLSIRLSIGDNESMRCLRCRRHPKWVKALFAGHRSSSNGSKPCPQGICHQAMDHGLVCRVCLSRLLQGGIVWH